MTSLLSVVFLSIACFQTVLSSTDGEESTSYTYSDEKDLPFAEVVEFVHKASDPKYHYSVFCQITDYLRNRIEIKSTICNLKNVSLACLTSKTMLWGAAIAYLVFMFASTAVWRIRYKRLFRAVFKHFLRLVDGLSQAANLLEQSEMPDNLQELYGIL